MMFHRKFVIFVVLFKSVHMASDTAMNNVFVEDSSLCDDGWKHYDKYCFKMQRIPKDWKSASADCKGMGGHLASIHSKEQTDFLKTISLETNVLYWFTGLHDHALDGIFVWDDGTDIEYTKWSYGEPDGDYYSGDCVAISFHGNNNGKWYVRPCDLERPYLCQKKFSVATTLVTDMDDRTLSVATTLVTDMDYRTLETVPYIFIRDATVPTVITVTKENDYKEDIISVPNFIITLILVIVFMALMGGILYYRRFWLKQNRLKVSKVCFKRTEPIKDPSAELIIEPKGII